MPSYAHLFEDQRGRDLVAFLTQVDPDEFVERMERVNEWRLGAASPEPGTGSYERHCVVCHGPEGRGDGVMAGQLRRAPANLVMGPFPFTGVAREGESLLDGVARVVKFGVPGTEMPGHEWLKDGEVAGLAAEVLAIRAKGGRE